MSYSEYKKFKISDAAEVITGFPFKGGKYSSNGIRVVRGENVTIGNLRWDTIKCWNEPFKDIEKYSLKDGDIVIGMDGSRVGKNRAQIKKNDLPLILAQRVARLRANDNFSQDFISYIIKSTYFELYVESIKTGTSIPHISPQQIKDFEFIAPNKTTQSKIANILSSIDDKIELNRQTNQTLETIAQTLFKEMCVPMRDEIPDRWTVGKLGDFYKTTSGGTPSRAKMEFYENGSINWVKSKELGNFFVLDTEEKITEEALKKSSAKLLPEKAILLAMYGATVGEISILGKEASCNQAICAILPNNDFPYSFVYEFLKNQKEMLKSMAVGGAQQNISQLVILGIDVIMPSEKILNNFHQKADAIYNLVRKNIEETQTLIDLRDSLLPKLMKGEIEINNL